MNSQNSKLLTFEQGCEFLGLKKSYVYKLTSSNILPYSKPNNGKIFFNKEKLEAWALSNENRSLEERQIEAATYETINGVHK